MCTSHRVLMTTLCFASVVVAIACGGSADTVVTSPTTTASPIPPGCSGSAVNSVEIRVLPGVHLISGNISAPRSIATVLNGEAFAWSEDGSGLLKITRDFVPCAYELTGVLGGSRTFSIEFARSPGYGGGFGGVERGSVESVEGPFVPVAGTQCQLAFTKQATEQQPPYTFRVRFRIATSNGCGTGAGTGANASPE